MNLRSGDAQDGLYLATIPLTFLSPTATTVEYFIEATDNDDMFGNCDHRVALPATGVFEVPITRIPVTPTIPECERCTSDQECLSGFCASLNGDTPVCLNPCGGQAPIPVVKTPEEDVAKTHFGRVKAELISNKDVMVLAVGMKPKPPIVAYQRIPPIHQDSLTTSVQ